MSDTTASRLFRNDLISRIRRRTSLIAKRDLFYYFDLNRRIMKEYIECLKPDELEAVKIGNYYLDNEKNLNSNSIIYSGGLGLNADFDICLAESYRCNIHIFDPTPLTISFGLALARRFDCMTFYPFGLWDEARTLEFTTPIGGGSASAVLGHDGDQKFDGKVKTISEVMKELDHNRIDVLKLDIEGAAIRVLDSVLEDGILPIQVVSEFERPPKDFRSILDYFTRLDQLISKMNNLGYKYIVLPRAQYNYFSIELLFSLYK